LGRGRDVGVEMIEGGERIEGNSYPGCLKALPEEREGDNAQHRENLRKKDGFNA